MMLSWRLADLLGRPVLPSRSPFAQPPLTLVLLLLLAARWALPVLIQHSNECVAK
jgi:hypothetical protein